MCREFLRGRGYACKLSLNDNIKNYLLSLKAEAQKPGLMGGGGVIPVIPPVKPKTIAEASALAKNMIKFK